MTFSLRGYEFAQESFGGTLEEMKPLAAQNHAETGCYNDLPFNPDYECYQTLAGLGLLPCFTVRLRGELVGFAAFILDRELQQQDIRAATQSVNYVAKAHRGIGWPFMKFCDDILKTRGINSIWRQSTDKLDVGRIYERMGYVLAEKSYLRRL